MLHLTARTLLKGLRINCIVYCFDSHVVDSIIRNKMEMLLPRAESP
jgi:hypothetical protein